MNLEQQLKQKIKASKQTNKNDVGKMSVNKIDYADCI